MNDMKTVAITGIGGYLGLSTAYVLTKAGYTVIGFGSNLVRPPHLPEGVVYQSIDINDTEAVAQFFKTYQVDVVYHFAAIKYVGVCEADPIKCQRINVDGTRSVLEAMVMADVPHIIYASTYAVYAWEGVHVLLQEDSTTNPVTVYGRSKLESEALILESANHGHIKSYQILRYANIVGAIPELSAHTPQSFLDKIITASYSGEVININGGQYDTIDGSVARDFVDISDVADIHLQLVNYVRSGIFNVSSGRSTTLKQLVTLTEETTGKAVKVEVVPAAATEPATIIVDNTLIREALEWSNKKSLKETIGTLSSKLAL